MSNRSLYVVGSELRWVGETGAVSNIALPDRDEDFIATSWYNGKKAGSIFLFGASLLYVDRSSSNLVRGTTGTVNNSSPPSSWRNRSLWMDGNALHYVANEVRVVTMDWDGSQPFNDGDEVYFVYDNHTTTVTMNSTNSPSVAMRQLVDGINNDPNRTLQASSVGVNPDVQMTLAPRSSNFGSEGYTISYSGDAFLSPNSASWDRNEYRLTSGQAPSAVGDLTAIPQDNGAVRFEWDSPSNFGISTDPFYAVELTKNGNPDGSTTLDSSRNDYRYGGLVDGDTVTFCITPMNIYGAGPEECASGAYFDFGSG